MFSSVYLRSEADYTYDIIIISAYLFIRHMFELLCYLLEIHDNWYRLVLN